MSSAPTRLSFLDYAKGISIILVVAGHYHPAASPDLWQFLRNFIYTFHMPAFFLVSGFLFFRELERQQPFSAVLKKKLLRLAVPFVVIATIFCLLKIFAGLLVKLDNAVSFSSIINVFILPISSFMPQLWFLQAILWIFIFYSLLHIGFKINHWIILAIALFLSFVNLTDYFSINAALKNFNYFAIGLIFAKVRFHEKIGSNACFVVAIMALPVAVLLFYLAGESFAGARATSYIGISGLFCLALFLGSKESKYFFWLKSVGYYSMGVYLFHTLFESPVRIAYYQILKLPDDYFWFGFFVAVAAGVIGSLLLEKYILRRFSLTRKYILGIK